MRVQHVHDSSPVYKRFVFVINLSSTGPKLDWDPDIVAALDDDFDFEDPDNVLDEDFILHANTDGKDIGPRKTSDDRYFVASNYIIYI